MRPALRYAVLLFAGVLACEPIGSPQPPVDPPVCGDGVQEGTEQCDKGPENSDTAPGACRTNCRTAHCGDSVLDPNEACDDGNTIAGDGCAATCRKIEQCGDGVLDPVAEQCDEGANNSDTAANRCRTNCRPAHCGDGVEDSGEECDDGNLENGDFCDSNCTRPRCGNGVTGYGEECDDGNTFNTDACKPDCTKNRCSGGVDSVGEPCFFVRVLPMQEDSDPRAVEIADIDGNGYADIAVVDRDDDTVKVYWNSGGSFTMAEVDVGRSILFGSDHPVDVAIGDINGDGKLDLATANESENVVGLLENKGNRAFERHFIDVPGKPRDVTLANIDGATGLEVVVGVQDDKEVRVIRLNQFTSYGTPQALPTGDPRSLTSGDIDGAGGVDIAWTTGSQAMALNDGGGLVKTSIPNTQSGSSTVGLWEINGAAPAELVTGIHGIFTRSRLRIFSSSDAPSGAILDTYSEVQVTKWPVYLARFKLGVVYADNGGTFGVLRNDQGTLLDERTFTYDADAKGLATGDLDNDGSPDVVIISQDKKAVLVFFGRAP